MRPDFGIRTEFSVKLQSLLRGLLLNFSVPFLLSERGGQ